MILSDKSIKERLDEEGLVISPLDVEDIQPCSVDLHLRYDLKSIHDTYFDLREEDYILKPDEFILGSTTEYVCIPENLSGFVDGKSSIGRLGVAIHITAGFIDPGFRGHVTLEIKNNSDKPFVLKEGMSIAQTIFFTLTTPCDVPYGDEKRSSHYQDSIGTILSRYEY